MKANRKNLSINIEFNDRQEAVRYLHKIIDAVKSGKINYGRSTHDNDIVEWSLESVNNMDYREEIINGKFCLVYRSKMNDI